MSRLLSVSGYIVSCCLVAVPLAAQDLRAMADRLDREVAVSEARRAASNAWREEARRFKGASDSVMIAGGAIKVIATPNAVVLARGAARIADSVLRQYPALTESIRGSVVSIEVDTARRYDGGHPMAVVRFSINSRAGFTRDMAEMNPDLVARMIEETATSRALDRTRGPYYRWHRANPPQRAEELVITDWGAVRFDVLSSRSLLGPRCYRGEIGACTMLLGLTTVDDPVMAWYDSLARFDAVSDNSERARRFNREAADRCLAGDDAACGRVLHTMHMFELPPGGNASRDALMRQALLVGGEGALDRLLTAKGTTGDALASAAGVPLDSVVKVWHRQLQEASTGSDDLSLVMIIVALGWIGILVGTLVEDQQMALTPFRWIAAAIIGMLVVTMAIMTEPRDFWEWDRYRPTPSEIEGTNLRYAADAARIRASRLANQYRIAQLADSVRPLAARSEPRTIRVSYAANVGETVRVALDSVVLKARERVGPSLKMGTDVVAIIDTFAVRGFPFMGSSRVRPVYVLPRDASQRCVVVLRVGRFGRWDQNSIMRAINTEDAQHQALGPCAYYAAFGMPGSRVREWLQRRGTMLAFGGSWTRVAEQPRLSKSDQNAAFKPDPFYGIGHAALVYLSHRGVRCSVGELAECEAGVVETNLGASQLAVGPAISPLIPLGPIPYWGGDFGGREAEMLAGMVRSLGRERFAAFWTSNEPLPVAFEKASGVSLGAWVSEWVNERMDPLKRGPKAPALTLLWAGLVMIASVLGGVLAAMRRQYS